jgi:hypothetical protein
MPTTVPETGLFLHAAAVLGPDGVILLMGHSSSGKTTLSSMISNRYPIVADDLVFAFPSRDGAWKIMNGQLLKTEAELYRHGATERLFKEGAAYPLRSLIRIFAAERSILRPLSPVKLCEYLMDAVFEISTQSRHTDINSRNLWFRAAANIARQYPGWWMQFFLNERFAVDMIRQTT